MSNDQNDSQRSPSHEQQLAEANAKAAEWEGRFKTSLAEWAIADAAVEHGAVHAQDFVATLSRQAEVVEEGDQFKVVIRNGDKTRTPYEAIAAMKALPEQHANKFKEFVIEEAGGSAKPPSKANNDIKSMSDAEFEKAFRENPESIGLPPKRKY